MFHIGTCSWTEKSLIQSCEFYPKKSMTSEDRLKYYSSQFNTVEVDSTYYAIPNLNNAYVWTERTPENFIFHIKVYGALTGHGIEPMTLPGDIRRALPEKDKNQKYIYIKEPSLLKAVADRFLEAINPLAEFDKLGIMVFQFPPWFYYKTPNLDVILRCKELMNGLPVGVEFRHGSWLAPDKAETVIKFLRGHQITYITADEPQYGSQVTIPFLPDVTTDIAYFRLHGRNKENWLKKGIETSLRYDYLYSDDELKCVMPSIAGADKKAKATYVMFNNCHGGFAMRNALKLGELMKSNDYTEAV